MKVLVLNTILSFILVTNMNYAQPQIFEIYPRLPRVDYYGVYFFNPDTGFAVGENGTVIKTTNGGESWQQKETPTSLTLFKIQAFSEDNIFICGFYGILLHSSDFGENWEIVDMDIESPLFQIKIIDEQTGWLCGWDSVLFKTENAGKTWTKKNTGFGGDYWDIDFFEEKIGYICSTSGILATEDWGKNWTNKGYPGIKTIEPVNDSIVIIGNASGEIFYSDNRGNTWIKTREPFHPDIQSLEMINDSIGYASANLYSGHYYTTNGGKNWLSSIERIGNSQITFVNDSIGYGVGIDLTLTKTTNGGKYWRRLIINDNITSIYFINDKVGFLGTNMLYSFERTKLFYTTDGGYSWIPNNYFDLGNPNRISSFYFIDSLSGYIGGEAGKIYLTNNGGQNWRLVDTIDIERGYIGKIIFIDSTGWAFAFGGGIKKTYDGIKWDKIYVSQLGFNSGFFLDTLNGWVTGSYFASTTDGGFTWVKDTLFTFDNYEDIFFSDIYNGWLAVDSNKVLKTTNGGQTWQSTDLIGEKFIKVDENTIYLTSEKSIYISTDNGLNWELRIEADIPLITSIPIINKGWGVDNISYSNNSYKIFKYEDNFITSIDESNNTKISNLISLKIYPLPANNQTTILYSLPEAGNVLIELFNVIGEKFETLYDGNKTKGDNKIIYKSSNLSSGVYFLRLSFSNIKMHVVLNKKLLFLK